MFTQFSDILDGEDRPHLIGELADRFGVTLRTIRFYEQRGLISPKRSDPHTRVFQGTDVSRLAFIVACRRLGLPVETIGDLLAERDGLEASAFREVLEARLIAHRATLEASLDEITRQLDAVGGWLGELTNG
jgi:DNA-binding transcriptional MerR regulator